MSDSEELLLPTNIAKGHVGEDLRKVPTIVNAFFCGMICKKCLTISN